MHITIPTLQVVDQHESQRVAGNGPLVSVINIVETSPELDEQHERCNTSIRWKMATWGNRKETPENNTGMN